MKFIHFEPQGERQKRYTLQFEFDDTTGVLSGTIGTAGVDGDLILPFSIELNNWVGKLIEVALVVTNNGYEVCVFDSLKNYCIGNGMPGLPADSSATHLKLFRMAVHEALEESTIQVRSAHDPIDGFENVLEDGNVYFSVQSLMTHDSTAARIIKLARLKSDMLGSIDQRDSVSYLEAQVDILTRLVLALHKDDTSTLTELLRVADAHSVLSIKDESALMREFLDKKALVRDVQRGYYASKKAIEEATA